MRARKSGTSHGLGRWLLSTVWPVSLNPEDQVRRKIIEGPPRLFPAPRVGTDHRAGAGGSASPRAAITAVAWLQIREPVIKRVVRSVITGYAADRRVNRNPQSARSRSMRAPAAADEACQARFMSLADTAARGSRACGYLGAHKGSLKLQQRIRLRSSHQPRCETIFSKTKSGRTRLEMTRLEGESLPATSSSTAVGRRRGSCRGGVSTGVGARAFHASLASLSLRASFRRPSREQGGRSMQPWWPSEASVLRTSRNHRFNRSNFRLSYPLRRHVERA